MLILLKIHFYRDLVLKLTFLSIFIGVLEVTSLNSIGPIINLFDSRNNIELPFLAQFDKDQTIFFSTLIFALCITIISFIKIKTIRYSNFLSAEIGQEIAVKLFGNYLGHDLLIHKARESTKILNAFTIHLNQTARFTFFILQFIVSIFSTVFILSFIILKTPLVTTGIFLSTSFVYIYIAKNIKPKNIKASKNMKTSADNISSLIQGINSNIEKHILEYRDKYITDTFANHDKLLRISSAKSRNYTILPRYIIESIAISAFIILSMLSSLIFRIDNFTLIANLSASLFGIQKLLPSINLIYQSWTQMSFCMPSIYAVKELILDKSDTLRIENSYKNKSHFKKYIEINNISFSYDRRKNILNNFSLKFNKGERILIKGKSGLGKTTLINIICSLINPSIGEIIVDGKVLGKNIDYSVWRRQIGLVKQKTFLKNGKIIDLILGETGNSEIKKSIKKAKYLAKLACIDDFIEKLPNGYFEYIDEDGKSLSGGQMQRIAIANALSLDPALLILDESTSGVDKETESKIFKNLFDLNQLTILTISHSKNIEGFFDRQITF